MTLRTMLSCLLSLAGLSGAERPFDSVAWPHRAFLTVPAPGGQAGYAAFKLDTAVYRHATSSLDDLRIVSPTGVEVPFTLREPRLRNGERVALHPRMVNRVKTPRGELQFVLDFGLTPVPAHNSLQLSWSEAGFRRPIRIESSANQSSWDLVKEAVLLDFRQDGLVYQTRRIDYPDSTRRYLRLTISDWADPATLVSVDSTREVAVTPQFTELVSPPIRNSPAQPEEGKGTAAFEFDMPFRTPSPVRLDFDVSGGNFVRAVDVQTRFRDRPWSTVCKGTIASVDGDGKTFVECSWALDGVVRVVIRNRDNSPVQVSGITILAAARSIVFAAVEAGKYALYAGNPNIRAPEYDLDEILARTSGATPIVASISSWQPNPVYRPPPIPLSERAKKYLTPLLFVVALAIAGAAFVLIRRTKAAQ